jgi:hypothetical protein
VVPAGLVIEGFAPLKKGIVMRTRIGLFCATVVLAVASPAAAAPKWEAFGSAGPVKLGPGDWAVALMSDLDADDPFGGLAYSPKKGTKFADLETLSVDYLAADGAFFGGSPRFEINVQTPTGVKNVFVYLGTPPAFDDEPTTWTHSGNLIGSTDLRFDTTQLGGPFYGDYQDARDIAGHLPVVGIQLVVDGGWGPDGPQTILVDNVTVNKDVLKAKGFKK